MRKAARADVMTREQRRRCMSHIRGSDTGPEIELRKALWHKGLRYRVTTTVVGRPDVVFTKQKIAVFVDGCFWHGCSEHGVLPKSNREFWTRKFRRNSLRDRKVARLLKSSGWVVMRFWEHELTQGVERIASRIEKSVIKRQKIAGN